FQNSGVDEIDLDFDGIDPGLVALVGENGDGKTTIVENLHSWPQLFTRGGTLKSHFRLRDSYRKLYFTVSGVCYRATILINAVTESASPEYYLDRGPTFESLTPVENITGRLKDYEEAIQRLFGSLDLFLRSVFVAQKEPKWLTPLALANFTQRQE